MSWGMGEVTDEIKETSEKEHRDEGAWAAGADIAENSASLVVGNIMLL